MEAWWVAPSIFAAAVAAAALIFKAGRWTGDVNSDRKQFREFMEETRGNFRELREDFRGLREDFQGLREDFRELRKDFRGLREEGKQTRKDLREVREDVDGIKTVLGRISFDAISDGSPLRLTDKGQSISEMLQAREWAERTAATLIERAKGKRPYEIQDISFEYVRNEFEPTEEQEVEIRTCAYEKGVKRDIVLDVMSVELRDALLKNA